MKWHKCNEEDIPDLNTNFILVRYKEDNKYFKYHIYTDCPLGWNVLERKNAEFMTLRIS